MNALYGILNGRYYRLMDVNMHTEVMCLFPGQGLRVRYFEQNSRKLLLLANRMTECTEKTFNRELQDTVKFLDRNLAFVRNAKPIADAQPEHGHPAGSTHARPQYFGT